MLLGSPFEGMPIITVADAAAQCQEQTPRNEASEQQCDFDRMSGYTYFTF